MGLNEIPVALHMMGDMVWSFTFTVSRGCPTTREQSPPTPPARRFARGMSRWSWGSGWGLFLDMGTSLGNLLTLGTGTSRGCRWPVSNDSMTLYRLKRLITWKVYYKFGYSCCVCIQVPGVGVSWAALHFMGHCALLSWIRRRFSYAANVANASSFAIFKFANSHITY